MPESELRLARQLNNILRERRVTISIAEGSSGGRIGERLVRYPGATAYFKGAVVTYDYPSRTNVLGIPRSLLERYGSVSETSVRAMAEQVREKFESDIGLASSGITGPAGRDIGHLWLALATDRYTVTEEHWLPQAPRIVMQGHFTELALRLLLRSVGG